MRTGPAACSEKGGIAGASAGPSFFDGSLRTTVVATIGDANGLATTAKPSLFAGGGFDGRASLRARAWRDGWGAVPWTVHAEGVDWLDVLESSAEPALLLLPLLSAASPPDVALAALAEALATRREGEGGNDPGRGAPGDGDTTVEHELAVVCSVSHTT